MRRKLPPIITLLILATAYLVACQTAVPTEADCPKPEFICVGLVTDLNGIEDKSYNQSAWQGVLEAQADQQVDWIRFIETIDAKDFEGNISTLANAHYDVIVTTGAQFSAAMSSTAKKYPDTHFISVDQTRAEVLPNLVDLVFRKDQAGFLAGVLAARLSKANSIAIVLASSTDASMVATKEGFEAGARYINPAINILSAYRPDGGEDVSSDPRWGASTAAQAIQNGADVIFSAGGPVGNGALIETANHHGIYCIGIDVDQWEKLPAAHSCLVSSAVQLVTPAISDILKLARDNAFPSGSYFGDAGLAPYHDFDSVIPQTVKDEINEVAEGLKTGSITTGYTPVK